MAGIDEGFKLNELHTLKLRQTSLSDSSLTFLITLCPNVKRLDVSFTLFRHPSPLLTDSQAPPLQKLSLTSTAVSCADLVAILALLPGLQTLSLGALGVNRGSRTAIGNSSAMMMTDEALRSITDVMEPFKHLQDLTLVGNTKLGTGSRVNSALSSFVYRVGRKCKVGHILP